MQIAWGEGGVEKFAGAVEVGAEGGGALCRDESMAEVDLGRDRKKMRGWKGDTLRRDTVKRNECGMCASEFMQPWPGVVENGVGVVRR